jgi:hypothetical protein
VVRTRTNNPRQTKLAAACLAAMVALAPVAAGARESNSKEASSDFGIGLVAVLANLVYMPVKVVYGVLGGVTGCFAYVLSGANKDVADGVWVPSLGGDYVLTTDMMTGRDQVHFNGVRDTGPRGGSADAGEEDEETGSAF